MGNIRIFYFKDKSTRISQPLTCVGLFVLGVSISEKLSRLVSPAKKLTKKRLLC